MDGSVVFSGMVGGLTGGGLLMFVLKNMKADISKRVTIEMCEQKYDTVSKGLKFLLEKCDKQDDKIDRDHDVLIDVSSTLKVINAKLDKLNNKP